ncbi:hypothetical protein AMTR_s00003p00144440 [Amborella trichopoda]|uniref:Pentatricopeptide repeat-containing protein n=1 Tax=Amborella trichopoda TaxID=13333 RepID=W1P047_AMBTC|nr:hypothetical protein AMTR_s00003p00144440 [Amborella trichopoda]
MHPTTIFTPFFKSITRQITTEANPSSWNALIKSHTQANRPRTAISFYNQMIQNGAPPNNFTFPIVLKACSLSRSSHKASEIHARILKTGFHSDPYVQVSLIHLSFAFGDLRTPRLLFHGQISKNSALWNVMISGGKLALFLFQIGISGSGEVGSWNYTEKRDFD